MNFISSGKPPLLGKVLSVLRRPVLAAASLASVLGVCYWLFIASDIYVSEAHVIVQHTDLSAGQAMDFSNLLAGIGNTTRPDQLLVRDHLLSVDMLRKLDGALKLRAHYSDPQHDLFSRMWSYDESIELFHRHYLSRVSVELDDYTGVLRIRAEAYDRRIAHAITSMLVQEGETFMNEMAHTLALAQVRFLEQQLQPMNARAMNARRAVLDFQDRAGMVSPQATAEGLAAIVARLEAERASLQTQRTSLQAYLVPTHPNIVMVDQQIAAIDTQIGRERARLAAPGGQRLNRKAEEFQRLEAEATFAQDIYKTALVALEKSRVEALRTVKKVSVVQTPTMPEYPVQPRRFYNSLVLVLVISMLASVAYLLVAIVRDHTD